jgi:hypothetical protein
MLMVAWKLNEMFCSKRKKQEKVDVSCRRELLDTNTSITEDITSRSALVVIQRFGGHFAFICRVEA